jgi:tetratricopeptide (TPR) repeat protein
MLTFYDAVWASAREYATSGRRADALASLTPLMNSPDAPPQLTLLAHRLAARLYAANQCYRRARKHLYAALMLDPDNAELHYELGQAFENDPYGCDWRAARRFRRAVGLDPQPIYQAAFGRALVRINRVRTGAAQLLEAADMAPIDADVLQVIVDGLCDAGRAEAAYRVAAKARFLAPNDAAIRRLWADVKFALAQRRQERTHKETRRGPTLLPFVRVETGERPTAVGGVVRQDTGSRTAPHLGRLRAYRTEQG